MLFLISPSQKRPNMISDEKDEEYHTNFARYFLGESNNHLHQNYLDKIATNKNFYKNEQWQGDEDLELFFKDENGNDRNRLKFTQNLIRPMVEQYRGNAVRMQINAKIKSISPKAVSRREQKLERMLLFTRIANQPDNPYGEDLKKRLPIGDSESETQQIFDNLYVDNYVETMNYLLDFVSDHNRFDAKQVQIAENMALAGIAVMKNFEYSGHHIFDFIQPENFIWDRSCKEYNLSDAEYQGDMFYMTGSEIYERAKDISKEQREAVENFISQYGKVSNSFGTSASSTQTFFSGRIPVFNVYWKDTDKLEYGYVMDEFGYPYFTKINFTYEGDEEPRYTDADLIQVKTVRAKKLLKGKLKRELYVDTMRFATFIPKEILGSASKEHNKNEGLQDLMFDWGVCEYQETESLDYNNVQFPYKAYCWGYLDGEVLSPIDDMISPQRFINRLLSVAENQINNARGSGMVYDKSVVDSSGGEEELLRNANSSRPIGVNAKGRGIQNVVGAYDSNIKQGTMVLFNIVDVMKQQLQNVTGVNEAIKGESTGSDQLVGVTQLMIQRGSLMQEPFYNAIAEIYLQCYQAIATVGKKIYADNERELTMAVGDQGYKIIKITQDMALETFRCFVKRENTDEILINAGNQMLMQFLQFGLIDKDKFALLYGRSSPDEISMALRAKAKEDREVARATQKADQEEEAVMQEAASQEQQQMQMQQDEAVAREDIKDLHDKQYELKKVFAKSLGNLAKTNPQAQQAILDKTKNLEANVV